MVTKTVRSRFNHEVGQEVAGCTILEKVVVIPPDPAERRLGVYDYVVNAPPVAVKPAAPKRAAATAAAAPERGTFTRSTPAEMNAGLIRRVPSR